MSTAVVPHVKIEQIVIDKGASAFRVLADGTVEAFTVSQQLEWPRDEHITGKLVRAVYRHESLDANQWLHFALPDAAGFEASPVWFIRFKECQLVDYSSYVSEEDQLRQLHQDIKDQMKKIAEEEAKRKEEQWEKTVPKQYTAKNPNPFNPEFDEEFDSQEVKGVLDKLMNHWKKEQAKT